MEETRHARVKLLPLAFGVACLIWTVALMAATRRSVAGLQPELAIVKGLPGGGCGLLTLTSQSHTNRFFVPQSLDTVLRSVHLDLGEAHWHRLEDRVTADFSSASRPEIKTITFERTSWGPFAPRGWVTISPRGAGGCEVRTGWQRSGLYLVEYLSTLVVNILLCR